MKSRATWPFPDGTMTSTASSSGQPVSHMKSLFGRKR